MGEVTETGGGAVTTGDGHPEGVFHYSSNGAELCSTSNRLSICSTVGLKKATNPLNSY